MIPLITIKCRNMWIKTKGKRRRSSRTWYFRNDSVIQSLIQLLIQWFPCTHAPSTLSPEKRGACRPHSTPWGWSPESCSYQDYRTRPASDAWLPPGSVAPPPRRSDRGAPTTRGTSGPPTDSNRMCSLHPQTLLPVKRGGDVSGDKILRVLKRDSFSTGSLSPGFQHRSQC